MPKVSEGRSWLAVEVPTAVADEFRAQARTEDRFVAALLRRLVRQHLTAQNDLDPAGNRAEVQTMRAGTAHDPQ